MAKAILLLLVLGLSALFSSLPAVNAGSIPSEAGTIVPQMDQNTFPKSEYLAPDNPEVQVPEIQNEVMSPAEIKAELDKLYSRDTDQTLQYAKRSIGTVFSEETSSTDQMIVRFNSFEDRDAFVETLPSGVLYTCLATLPYVIISKTSQVYHMLTQTTGITRIMDDRLLSAPEYQAYDVDNKEYDLSMYNSEGRIGSWDMHSLGYTGKGVKVAVLDTGIDSAHPDLMYTSDGHVKVIAEQSFIDVNFDGIPDEGPEDIIGHGTHVAGTVAGNGYQIGVAPDALLMNAKVCSSIGCATSWMIEAVEWAILNDADIITMSIGGSTFWGLDALDDILDYAWQQGIVVTIAAGNDGPAASSVQSPGTGPRVITVASSDGYDLITAFSGRGPSAFGHYDPDIAAPGDYIFSTLPGAAYGIYGGTSMATPHVAGAAALLLEAHPRANPDMVKANLMWNAKDVGLPTTVQGAGLVDLVETNENWNKYLAILFPTFNEYDVLYLSPGETFTGYFSYVNSRQDPIAPWFKLDKSDAFEITIDRATMTCDMWKEFFGDRSSFGQQFIPFTVTAPSNALPGDQFSREITAYYWKGTSYGGSVHPLRTKMTLTIEMVQPEDDAYTGTDASDTFPGATEVPFGNYSGYMSDIDYYKVWLEADETYTFILDGLLGYSDYDLAVYGESGEILNYGYTGGGEVVTITTETEGYYILRVDPWSLLIDPWANMDTTGPYNLWMLVGGETGGGGSGGNGTLVEYVSSDIFGTDFDGDSIYDYLVVSVTLDVSSPGLLDIYAFLALDKSPEWNKWLYGVAFAENLEITATGIQEVYLFLEGTNVADQNFVGSHVLLELFIGDPSTFTILLDLLNVYTSPVLDSADFGQYHMQYSTYSVEPFDEDADGTADWLAVDVTVDIGETFDYWMTYFTCTLYHPAGYFFWNAYDPILDLSVPGLQTMRFLFDPATFVTGQTGTLDLEIVIVYSWDHPLNFMTLHNGMIPYILAVGEVFTVDLADFTSGGGVSEITDILDYGLDVDGDTRFDYLAFDVSIHVESAGYFALSLQPWLWSIPDQEVVFAYDGSSLAPQWYEPGDYTITLLLSGEVINGAGNDGPFLVLYFWLDLYEMGYYGLDFVGTPDFVQNYETEPYVSSDFDTSGAKFIGISAVNYVDLNADGSDESIELVLEFEVGYPCEFDIMLEMYSYPIDAIFYMPSYVYTIIETPGIQTVSVILDGQDFYQQQYQGKMEIWVIDVWSIDNATFTFTNAFFSYQNGLFDVDYTLLPGAAPAASIYGFYDYGLDINGNGFYDYLVVNFLIEVQNPRDFLIYMDVWGDASTGYWSLVGFYSAYFTATEQGLMSIELYIPSEDILNNVYDEYTNFELWVTLVDATIWYQLDFLGPVYTDWYYIPDFEPALGWIESVFDYAEDTNGNGLFENLVVSVTLNIHEPRDLFLDMEFFGGASTGYSVHIGSFYDFLSFPDPGLLIVELRVPSTSILNSISDAETDFLMYLSLQDAMYGEELDFFPPVFTNWYDMSNFEPASVGIVGIYDYPEDTNGNGLFENLVVGVTLDIQRLDDFIIIIDVWGDASMEYYSLVGTFDAYFTPSDIGSFSLELYIPSGSILNNVLDPATDFQVNVQVWDAHTYAVLDRDGPFYTGWYDMSDFEPASSIYGVFDYGLDANGNGLYDALMIEVLVELVYTGEFIVDLAVWGDASTGYTSDVGSYSVYFSIDTPGIYSVPIQIPSIDILNSIMDESTDFELYIWLVDADTYTVIDHDYAIYTNWYAISDFEVAWQYSTYYYTYDADGDTCDDTIDVGLDFAFYNLSGVDVEIYLDAWYWDNVTANYTYIETLVQSFSVTENPSFFSIVFTWPAPMDGDFAFVLSIYIDGELFTYEFIYWYGACEYIP